MEQTKLRRRGAVEPTQSFDATSANVGPAARAHETRQGSGWETWNPTGLAVYCSFLVVSAVYFYVRVTTTLDVGPHKLYAYTVLFGEAFGAFSVVLYGLTIIRHLPALTTGASSQAKQQQLHFNVQVLVPCYTEALEIVTETVWAARMADIPAGCTATVWLLDDGNDAAKAAWVSGMADPNIRYISGRRRPRGEVNGKAGNVNNAMRVIYKDAQLSADDVLAIFDCDQVCNADFFVNTLPLMAESGDISMVLTPQQFGNVDEDSDVFNHTNRHFWEVMIPGLTAWGMLVCTGSNFLVRAAAVKLIGGMPTQTITEDYMLSLELAKRGFQSRYLLQYMVTGEAPEEGAVFRQRSRWCKGHIQALFSGENPLLQRQLSWKLKVFYTMGTMSYICAAFTVPLFVLVPVIAVTSGAFPLSLNASFAAVFPFYFALLHAVVYFCDSWGLLRALWFGGVSTQILWFTYLKAIVNTLLWAAGLKKKGRFKTTIKTGALTGGMGGKSNPMTPRTPMTPFAPGLRGLGSFGDEPRQPQQPARPQSNLGLSSTSASDLGEPRHSDSQLKPTSSGQIAVAASSVTSQSSDSEGQKQQGQQARGLGVRFSSELERMLAEKQATTFSQPPGKSNLSLAGSTEQPSEPAWHPSATAEPSADGAAGEGGGLARQSPLTTSGSGIPRPPKHKPSLSLVTMTSLSRVASTLERSLLLAGSGSLVRQPTSIQDLNSQLSLSGRRPSWNLQAKPVAPTAAEPPQAFDLVRVRAVAYGRLRDLWAPLLMFLLSAFAALLGLAHIVSSPQIRGVGSSLPGVVTVIWALYNCIGPYLLLHYSCFGRGTSLQKASSASMALFVGLGVLAVLLVYVFAPADYDYGQVLDASYRFYEAQRSGVLPAGNRIPWRGDSALHDSAPNGASLVGGWYDAGDHLKTSFSTAIATSFLSWGLLQFRQGHAKAGQVQYASEAVRWAGDWLMRAHISPDEFVGQVGNIKLDHDFWGRPEDMEAAGVQRPVYLINATQPGSDMAGAAAAALASASLVWRERDAAWAGLALQHAQQLYAFGRKHPGCFSQSVPEMGAVYQSTAWRDDMAWGAAWLHAATQEPRYEQQAHAYLHDSKSAEADRWQYYVTNWDNLLWATQTLLATAGKGSRASTAAASRLYVDRWRMGEVVNYTRGGLAFSDDWGALRNTANVAMLAFLVAQDLPQQQARPYECWAHGQLRYMLGDGPRSFVVGYGKAPPVRPHHRAASCPAMPLPCNESALHAGGPNPHVLVGALVGGPTRLEAYPDDRADYVTSEVGIEYSAGFTAALAGALQARTTWAQCMQGHGALW